MCDNVAVRDRRPDEVAELARLNAIVDLLASKMKQRLFTTMNRGRKGWENVPPMDMLDHAQVDIAEYQAAFDTCGAGRAKVIPPTDGLIDAANFLLFGWYNAERVKAGE